MNLNKFLVVIMLVSSGVAEAQLRNAPRSLWQRITSRLGVDQETKIVKEGSDWILLDEADQKQASLRELALWSGRRARGRVNLNLPVIVNDLMPQTILANDWSQPLLNGPNCHNNTLLTLGLHPRRMYVGDREMTFSLETFCRRLSAPEVNAVGIRRSRGSIIHSYLVVSDRLIFEKTNLSRNTSPEFNSFSDERRRNDEFYRCANRNLRTACSPQALQLAAKVDVLHRKMEDLIFRLKDSFQHDDFLNEVRELQSNLQRADSCAEYRELLLSRLESINTALIEFEKTGAYIGRGTYDRQPRY